MAIHSTYQTPAFTIFTSGTHIVALVGAGNGSDYTAFVDDVRLDAAVAAEPAPGEVTGERECALDDVVVGDAGAHLYVRHNAGRGFHY